MRHFTVAWLSVCFLVCDAITVALEGPDVLVRVVIADGTVGNRTYLSELFLKRSGSLATSNVLFNFSQLSGGFTDSWSTSRLSSTAVSLGALDGTSD